MYSDFLGSNFDLDSFIFGASFTLVTLGKVLFFIYVIPLIIRFLKWLIVKIIFSIRNRNSPPSGEDK